MKKRILKYRININRHKDISKLKMPIDSKLLGMGIQEREVFAWFEVDTNKPYKFRNFYCIYTGNVFDDDNLQFRQTMVFSDQRFVVHIYEEVDGFLSQDDMEL